MAGQLCAGRAADEIKNGKAKTSDAYCEGMQYRTEGTALEKPITDNPHEADSEAEEAWNLGWTLADDNAGGTISQADMGCCSVKPAVSV